MIAAQLITDEIPPIKVTETITKAMDWMNEFKVSHLPVVENMEYHGLLHEDSLWDVQNEEQNIQEAKIQLDYHFAYEHQHWYDVMRIIGENHLSVLPIISAEKKYLGCTTMMHVMALISKSVTVAASGGVIVLETTKIDYSLAQIAQIVESNDAKILSTLITSSNDSNKIEVTVKINIKDLTRILQTFNRYDYVIKETYQETSMEDPLQSRYEMLMNYLKY